MDFGGIASAGLDLLSGILNSAGAVYQNRMSRKSARHAQKRQFEFAAQQAQVARDFAERMANTAHQREVSDLRAAGLNPILSAGGSGASSPVLAAVSSSAVTPDVVNPASGLASGLSSSAKSLQKFLSQEYQNHLDQQESDIRSTDAQSSVHDAQSRLLWDEANRSRPALDREAENDAMRAYLEQAALMYETGLKPEYDDHGRLLLRRLNSERYMNALDLARQGVRSDLKNRSNQNWRANLGAVTGALGGVNSAASAAGKFKWLFRK